MTKREFFHAAMSPKRNAGLSCLAMLLVPFGLASAQAVEFDCVVDPRQVVEVRSLVDRLIEKIIVDRGDFVKKG